MLGPEGRIVEELAFARGLAWGQKRSQKASPTAKASSDTIRPEGRALISHSRIFNGDMEFPVYSTPSISLATNSKAKRKIILIWEICTKIGVRKHKIDENEKFWGYIPWGGGI